MQERETLKEDVIQGAITPEALGNVVGRAEAIRLVNDSVTDWDTFAQHYIMRGI